MWPKGNPVIVLASGADKKYSALVSGDWVVVKSRENEKYFSTKIERFTGHHPTYFYTVKDEGGENEYVPKIEEFLTYDKVSLWLEQE